jgi:hypothetical protein
MWFDPKDERAVFVDKRKVTMQLDTRPGRNPCVIAPDVQCDFTDMPFDERHQDLQRLARRRAARGIDHQHIVRLPQCFFHRHRPAMACNRSRGTPRDCYAAAPVS